jgi:hypothetical protein
MTAFGGFKEIHMVHSNMKKLAVLAAAVGFMTASQAFAADVTDVLDAADEVYLGNELVKDPFDIALTPTFKQRYEWAKLKREYNQSGYVRLLNELQYERVVNQMDIDLEVGMFHDLSLRVKMPIVFSDQSSYKFDTSSDKHAVTSSNSWFSNQIWAAGNTGTAADKANFPYKFFDLSDGNTLKGTDRSGIGDMSFGIAWSPFNSERHYIPERPWEREIGRSTITLGFDYIAPIGEVRSITNDKIGNGVHELIFSVAASHRFSFVDPYIRLQYGYPVAAKDDDTYKEFNSNQTRVLPGMWGRIDLGAEFIPYESIDPKFQRFVKIDLRGYFKYTAEGRAYSELADAFGKGNCYSISTDDLAAHPECNWVAEKWSNAGSENINAMADKSFKGQLTEDGIFDYEGFATVGGALNLNIQPIQYVAIIAGVAADYSQNHFITYTKVGRDRGTYEDGKNEPNVKDGVVSLDSKDERSPVFSGALDAAGSRIKRTESINLEWFVGLRLMY